MRVLNIQKTDSLVVLKESRDPVWRNKFVTKYKPLEDLSTRHEPILYIGQLQAHSRHHDMERRYWYTAENYTASITPLDCMGHVINEGHDRCSYVAKRLRNSPWVTALI